MRPLDARERARMRETSAGGMNDAIVILRFRNRESDAHGQPREVYEADPNETPCSWGDVGSRKIYADAAQTVLADATCGISNDTSISAKDRVRLVRRFGESVPPHDYNLGGPPTEGISRKLLKLTTVTNGTVQV